MFGNNARRVGGAVILALVLPATLRAQFLDDFSQDSTEKWTWLTGDGNARMKLLPRDGFATISVDATDDRQNIWWALIKRDVSSGLDLRRLQLPNQELRISARVRASDAPRRVNLHLNTQKTTDFHTHLMEFDIPTTGEWHAISFTTRDFQATPGDTVHGQLALMDWGLGEYSVDVDDFRVDVVDVTRAGPDQGQQVPYHPPIAPVESFSQHLDAAEAAMIDLEYPDLNLSGWVEGETQVLAVGGSQRVILRWDFQKLKGRRASGSGILELTTHSLERSVPRQKDFGMIRVAEILGGDPQWKRQSVTLAGFVGDEPLDDVFNPQMIIDVAAAGRRGAKTMVTISEPVLQRMLDGRTRGLVLLPLGAIHASFCTSGSASGAHGPRLHFRLLDP